MTERKIRTVVYACYIDYPHTMGWSGFAEGRYCRFIGTHETEASAWEAVRAAADLCKTDR